MRSNTGGHMKNSVALFTIILMASAANAEKGRDSQVNADNENQASNSASLTEADLSRIADFERRHPEVALRYYALIENDIRGFLYQKTYADYETEINDLSKKLADSEKRFVSESKKQDEGNSEVNAGLAGFVATALGSFFYVMRAWDGHNPTKLGLGLAATSAVASIVVMIKGAVTRLNAEPAKQKEKIEQLKAALTEINRQIEAKNTELRKAVIAKGLILDTVDE